MVVRKSIIFIIVLSFLSFVFATLIYSFMPEMMASHWNIEGEVDGYISRVWGVFFLPILVTVMSLFFVILPLIDPRKENIEKFRDEYDRFIVSFAIFLTTIYLFTILWNIGVMIPVHIVMAMGVSLLIFKIGVLMEKAKMNWFIGIRTPWTMSNEKVWTETHRLGGILYKYSAIFILLGVLNPIVLLYSFIPLSLSSLYLILHSYLLYRKYEKV